MKYVISILVLISLVFVSCDNSVNPKPIPHYIGSENIVKDTLGFATNNMVLVESGVTLNVYYMQSDKKHIVIETNDNIRDRVLIEKQPNDVIITVEKNATYENVTLNVYISSPDVNIFNFRGKVNLYTLNDVELDQLFIESRGTSTLSLTGVVESQMYFFDGQVQVSNFNLISQSSVVFGNTSGSIQLTAKKKMKYNLFGNVSLVYDGSPEESDGKVSGGATARSR